MNALGEPDTWPREEACPECSGTKRATSEVRRTSTSEPHVIEHACVVCGSVSTFIGATRPEGVRA